MPKYTISNLNPQTKFCEISAAFDAENRSLLELSIPRWRPARYSLQNYVELIQGVKFYDGDDQPLSFTKLNLDTWIVQTHGVKQVKVIYSFYANQFEAGGSFIDQDFVLLNPINCLMYDKNRMDIECCLEILSEDYDIIRGRSEAEILRYTQDDTVIHKAEKILKRVQDDTSVIAAFSSDQGAGLGVVNFQNYHHLVDTPLLLVKKDSAKLKTLNFEVKDLENGKIDIEVAIYGENKLDLAKVEADFKAFIFEQVKIFKTFAVKNYTFLCILPDFPAYHGVEHQHSSVNIFGPGYTIDKPENYKQFLGLCCHEFFHHWNIKSMRPKELNQYDYSKEQLFTTGYVAEGFTTYYGDLILYRAGLISLEDFAKILSRSATSHIQNFGRFRSSMHESSLDLWLDGYKAGIPDDKVNIYTEGCLLALILDFKLRSARSTSNHTSLSFRPEGEILAKSEAKISHFVRNDTGGQTDEILKQVQDDTVSLDHLLYNMFKQFGHQNVGYTEHDLIQLCNEISGVDFTVFFHDFYGSKVDLIDTLSLSLDFLDLKLEVKDSSKSYESNFGFKIGSNGEKLEITKIYPNSASYQKLTLLDQLIAINGKTLTSKNYEDWFEYFKDQDIKLQLSRKGEIYITELSSDKINGLKVVEVSKK